MPNTIPMYVFTGFLESGKTKFIQETLEDERFNAGEKSAYVIPPAQLWQTFAVSLFHLCNPQKRPGSFLHIALEPALNTYVLSRVLLHPGRKHPYVQSDGIRLPMLPFAQSSEKVVKLFLRHNFPIATAFRRWND